MAAMAVAQHHGRPHTPTDQAWIETLFGHVKGRFGNERGLTIRGARQGLDQSDGV